MDNYPFSKFLLFPQLMWREDIGATSDLDSSSAFWGFFCLFVLELAFILPGLKQDIAKAI